MTNSLKKCCNYCYSTWDYKCHVPDCRFCHTTGITEGCKTPKEVWNCKGDCANFAPEKEKRISANPNLLCARCERPWIIHDCTTLKDNPIGFPWRLRDAIYIAVSIAGYPAARKMAKSLLKEAKRLSKSPYEEL